MNAPYVKNSPTSRAAAESIPVSAETAVRDYIHSCGSRGTTDSEIEIALNMRHQTASARRRTLEKKGVVVLAEEKRKTDSGRMAGVYVHSEFACSSKPVTDECPHEHVKNECYGYNLYRNCQDCGRVMTIGNLKDLANKCLSKPETDHAAFIAAVEAKYPQSSFEAVVAHEAKKRSHIAQVEAMAVLAKDHVA